MKLVPKAVTRSVGRTILKTKKNSPHIFFVGGVVGVVGSTFLACKATLKLEPVVDEIKQDFEIVKDLKNNRERPSGRVYTDQDYYRDLGYVYGKSGKKLVKLYGPAVVLGAASISALAGSHIQLTRRNATLTAALVTVTEAYENYRLRVQAEVGEERERDLYLNMTEETVEDEDGKKKKVKVVNEFGWSPYARFFDSTSKEWRKSSEYNRMFVQCQQDYANHQLRSRGHIFLNEVYDSLGLERTSAGQIVGWVMNGDGDNHVDFGIHEAWNERFNHGLERSLLLDFNVDGPVFDKI